MNLSILLMCYRNYIVSHNLKQIKEENWIKEYHTTPIITQEIIEKPKCNKSLYMYFKNYSGQIILYCFNIIEKNCDCKQGVP